MNFTNLIGLIIVIAISSKIHCAPIEQEKSDQIEASKFYQKYFGKPQYYSELPKKYALDFIPEVSKQEPSRLYQEHFGNPQYSKLPETYALEFGSPKEPNTDIEAAQFYRNIFENPQFSKLPEKYALEVGPKEPNVNIEVSQLYKKVYGNPQLYSELPQQYALDFIPEESETEKNYNKPK